MSTIKFVEVYNLVVFLSKPIESEGFEEIVDFLNANPIKHVLTGNPIVYTSCIEQFLATVKAKTIDREGQLQALVDGKKILITESTIRRYLQLEDAEGVDCLPNVVIFEQLTLMGDSTEHVTDEAINEEMDNSLERATTTATSLDVKQDRGNIFKTNSRQHLMSLVPKELLQVVVLGVSTPRSGKDSLKLNELMKLCTKLQQSVLDLETTKTTQALKIDNLKRRVKKLKRRKRSRTHGLKRIYKVSLSARVESSEDKGLGEKDASKQERDYSVQQSPCLTRQKILSQNFQQVVSELDCKKNNDSLNSKITDLTDKLFDANNFIYHYKLVLAQVESRLVEYKEREVKYIEKIRTLEFYRESNRERIETLSKKLETLKLEKNGVDGKLAGLLTASKDLDNQIESQSMPSPTVESTLEEDQNKNPSVTKIAASDSTILSKPAIKFVKAFDKAAERPTTTKVEAVKKSSLGENFVMKKKACYNCSSIDHLSYDCGLGVKKRRSFPKNNYTAIYRVNSFPTVDLKFSTAAKCAPRPKINSARPNKPAHSYGRRPFQETTQDLMIILIQRVQRLERKLKARTPIHKVDRGRYRPVMAWVPKKGWRGHVMRLEALAGKGVVELQIVDIDANKDITLVSTRDKQMFDADQDLGGKEIINWLKEQQELNDKEKATLFMQLLKKRRKFFAAKRAEEKRNKPSTQAQQRKIMYTYLKNMEGKKLTDLTNKSFDSIQKMFDRAFKRGSFKRAGTELEQESSKKQKIDDDKDTAELKYYMLKDFDKEDVETLWKLVEAKYGSTRPEGEYERVLWGDLKVIFNPHVEDEVWKM
nr:hypothetical protein [Tanacetum cinerariifolium]